MKRINIPIEKDISPKTTDIKNKSTIPMFISFDLDDIASKLTKHTPLTYYELLYVYDIYNTRWISDMYTKFDYEKGTWQNDIVYHSTSHTHTWRCKQDETKRIDYINERCALNFYDDLAIIFDCRPFEITSDEKAVRLNSDKYVILLGNMIELTYAPKLKYVSGNVVLPQSYFSDEAIFPNLEAIGGYANFLNLTFAENLTKLRSIGGPASFNSLRSAKHLTSLETIAGSANFRTIEISSGLDKLKIIGGYANFLSLEEAKHLTSLEIIAGAAEFRGLKSSAGLENLKCILGAEYFSSLDSYDCLNLLNSIDKGTANLKKLKR